MRSGDRYLKKIKSIRIGAHIFRVLPCDQGIRGSLTQDEDKKKKAKNKRFTYGEVDVSKGEVRIAKGMTKRAVGESVMHEIIHAALELGGTGSTLKRGQEETLTQSLGHQITQVLLDNPRVRDLYNP